MIFHVEVRSPREPDRVLYMAPSPRLRWGGRLTEQFTCRQTWTTLKGAEKQVALERVAANPVLPDRSFTIVAEEESDGAT